MAQVRARPWIEDDLLLPPHGWCCGRGLSPAGIITASSCRLPVMVTSRMIRGMQCPSHGGDPDHLSDRER